MDHSTDDLLDNILEGLGGPGPAPVAKAAGHAGGNPFARQGAVRTQAVAAPAPGTLGAAPAAAAPKPQITKTFTRAPAAARSAAATAAPRVKTEAPSPVQQRHPQPMDEDFGGFDEAPELPEEPAAAAGATAGATAGDFSFDTPGKGVKPEPLSSPIRVGAAKDEAGVKEEAAATPAADGMAANRSRLFADSPAPAADAAAGAAHGWQELCDLEMADGGTAAAAAAAAAAADAAGAAEAGAADGLQLDGDGNMPFYLIDAYENPDRPGEQECVCSG